MNRSCGHVNVHPMANDKVFLFQKATLLCLLRYTIYQNYISSVSHQDLLLLKPYHFYWFVD